MNSLKDFQPRDTPSLSRRIERSHALERFAYIDQHRQIFPERTAERFEVGGALLTICGSHAVRPELGHRYFSRLVGFGGLAPADVKILEELEDIAARFSIPARLQVVDASIPEVLPILEARGYRLEGVTCNMARMQDVAVPLNDDIKITEIDQGSPTLRSLWARTIGRGFADDMGLELDPISHVMSHVTGKRLFVATTSEVEVTEALDEKLALGSASCGVFGDVGWVNGAATVPTARGRGVQAALIAARVEALREHPLLAATCAPGSGSQRNLIRFGFENIYSSLSFVKS